MNSQNIQNSEQSSNNRSSNNESSNNQSSNNLSSNNFSSNNHSSNNQSSDSYQASSYETPNTDPQLQTSFAEDSDYYRNFLEQLLDLVCNEDQETVARLVSIIRSGASQREILAVISQMQNGNNHLGGNGGVMES
ncbi:hypothetical protein BDV32DRAFT_146097 [Aspergillus pseudonomiae]|uniref:Uncharacterized protein n=1 Tax=Aspergillus pseudonomiae TaxID=1506151 RepID=A0A5N7CST2_9EURO|nr:uncharacterized protein BDV37DRAFT_277022 [Aspergillus pseudonomiae]KAB8263795.1 hypothetical protein BDV32DRAFT_146097 [Aspergillus pseudonomiae]KAE8397300.1 hypothetical protein BDV37DRAFT_277022 [Aspergillus pseudonomiae]